MDDDLLNRITYLLALLVFTVFCGVCCWGTYLMSVRLGW